MTVEKIYWDSDCFLGHFQAEPGKAEKCDGVIQRAERGDVLLVTSALTIAEVLWMRGAPRLPKDKSEIVQKFFKRSYIRVYNLDRKKAEAAKWYRKAAEQGDVMAQYSLGGMYFRGEGVSQNFTEAVKWFRKAAEQGDAYAQVNLGFMYGTGEGVPMNYVKAYMWYSLSKAQGNEDAAKGLYIIEKEMTPAQIAKAQELAAEWLEKHN